GAWHKVLHVKTTRRTEMLNITAEVSRCVEASGVSSGVCYIYSPHTTAGITINEGHDPDVAHDLEAAFDRIAPRDWAYKHYEKNSDSHIKTSLVGTSQFVIVEDSRLQLGQWQSIFLCEFDGPRTRDFHVKIQPDPAT